MNIDVAFTPSEVQAVSRKVCIVVDVVRATSTMAVIMSRKPGEVILTPTVQKAVKFASQQGVHPVLCGERGCLPPEGFDYGNSPREFVDADLTGKTVIFTSSNGTRAVADVAIAPHVLLGSFLNSAAVVDRALDCAFRDRLDIMVVCAGREEKFAIDDAWCAGYIISLLAGGIPADENFELGDGGQAALGIYGYYRDPEKLFTKSGSGKAVLEAGLIDDIPFLLQKDCFTTVPTLTRRSGNERDWGFSLLV
ncbi:MAG: 2-phosphosulfolactate phosphatase [Candidatus Riflebacteria bacterium]|nr:2-phosphosulfolactate phosphatase [Candidatus Riflebacteria bacterium]